MNTHTHIEGELVLVIEREGIGNIEIFVALPYRFQILHKPYLNSQVSSYHFKSCFHELYPSLLTLTGAAASLPACWDMLAVTILCFVFSEPSFLPHWSG